MEFQGDLTHFQTTQNSSAANKQRALTPHPPSGPPTKAGSERRIRRVILFFSGAQPHCTVHF